jgi:hypothetical protein
MFDLNLYQDKVEKAPWLLIMQSKNAYDFKVCYSVPISAKAGDIIYASFRGEVTSEQPYNVQIGSFVTLGVSATDTSLSKSILPPAGGNVTPAEHHKVFAGGSAWPFTSDFDGFVNVVLYANSSAAGPGQTIEVMQGYGKLDVMHFVKANLLPPSPPEGSITLTAEQRQQIISALLEGAQERLTAAALLQ